MKEILTAHKLKLLTPGQVQAIKDIITEARAFCRKKDLITNKE
jgi:hypothetical protein